MVARTWVIRFEAIALLGALFTGGCAKQEPACLFVLFDQSVQAKASRDLYAREFATKVVDHLAGGDMVIGRVITEKTDQTTPTTTNSFEATIPTFSRILDNELQYRGKIASSRRKLNENASSILTSYAKNSDIMSGFRLADKVFKGQAGKPFKKQVLILFTDAVEQTPSYDFTNKDELLSSRSEEIIKAEKQAGRLPDLAGVEVYMVGVTLEPAPQAGITREKAARIQDFWRRYCKACGANLDSNNYGPTLANLKLH